MSADFKFVKSKIFRTLHMKLTMFLSVKLQALEEPFKTFDGVFPNAPAFSGFQFKMSCSISALAVSEKV